MKYALIFVAFGLISGYTQSAEAKEAGCMLNGTLQRVGAMEAVNDLEIAEREGKGEYVPDGEAVMMRCTFLVDPKAEKWPAPEKRVYKWVAFSWGW